MNWGKGLMIAMIAFMGFIATMVVIMISHSVELDNPEYYKLDQAFNAEMEAVSRETNMTNHVVLMKSDSNYIIQVPSDEFITDVSVFFNRPNDETQDFVIEVGDKRLEKIPMEKFNPGIYNIEIRFFARGEACLQKQRIYVK